MYIKSKLTENDYKDIAKLMRSLMIKFKIKYSDKVVKEISMPDMMDILCKREYVGIYKDDIIKQYWTQINENPDNDISTQLYLIIEDNLNTAKLLRGCGFTQNELQWIINNYIKDIPVIYIKEEN